MTPLLTSSRSTPDPGVVVQVRGRMVLDGSHNPVAAGSSPAPASNSNGHPHGVQQGTTPMRPFGATALVVPWGTVRPKHLACPYSSTPGTPNGQAQVPYSWHRGFDPRSRYHSHYPRRSDATGRHSILRMWILGIRIPSAAPNARPDRSSPRGSLVKHVRPQQARKADHVTVATWRGERSPVSHRLGKAARPERDAQVQILSSPPAVRGPPQGGRVSSLGNPLRYRSRAGRRLDSKSDLEGFEPLGICQTAPELHGRSSRLISGLRESVQAGSTPAGATNNGS